MVQGELPTIDTGGEISSPNAEMLKPRGQTGLEAKILASASGPFGLGLKLLVSASNFNI